MLRGAASSRIRSLMNFAQLRELYEHAPSPAPASIAALEKMVRLQRDALTQAEQDLAAAREKPRPARPARRSHSPSAGKKLQNFWRGRFRSPTGRARQTSPSCQAGCPEGGARLSAEQTVEVILRAKAPCQGRRAARPAASQRARLAADAAGGAADARRNGCDCGPHFAGRCQTSRRNSARPAEGRRLRSARA